MASTCVNSKQNYSKPRRYCTRRGVLQIHRHLHGPIFAEREGSHEVPNRRLERHCVDCRLPWALPLCSQRSDYVEIASIMLQATRFTIASRFLEEKGERIGLAWLLQPALLRS